MWLLSLTEDLPGFLIILNLVFLVNRASGSDVAAAARSPRADHGYLGSPHPSLGLVTHLCAARAGYLCLVGTPLLCRV